MAYTSYESTKPSFMSTDWPVIIMHGLLGSKANWNAMSKMLHNKTNRKIFAVDARNHGDSPHTNEMTYTHLVEDLRALMSDLNIKQATFIGHSMGGRAAMLMALRYDSGTRQFILTNLVEAEGGCYKWRINLDSIARNFNSLAAFPTVGTSCPVPTLFVAGSNSDYVRSEDHEEIRGMFPAAKFETIPGAGHWVHADKPNELLVIMKDFIQNVQTIEGNV